MFFRALIMASACFAQTATAQNFPPITALPPLENVGSDLDGAAMAALGELLFFDTRLSGDSSTSCASCHDPAYGWGDGSDLARGYPGTMHWRNSQTLINSAYLTGSLHWDGTVPSLTEQVPGAMGTSVVSNMDHTLAEERLRQIPVYVQMFENIWNAGPDIAKVSQSIAAFERTLISDDSPFDRFSRGETDALDAAATRGMAIFQGKGSCQSCHNGALTTDMLFHNTSVPANPSFTEDPLRQITFRTMMRGFGIERDIYETFDRDPGRFLATGDPADLGTMRTPPLRYLTYTAPYMHNGAFYTLEEVVDFYNRGGTADVFGTKSPLIAPLGLTTQEQSDLVAFLKSMSGTEVVVDFPDLPNYALAAFPQSPFAPIEAVAVSPATPTADQTTQTGINPVGADGVMTINLESDLDWMPTGVTVVPEQQGQTPAATVVTENGQRIVIVKAGDTLGTLAAELYGDVLQYQKIYDANRDRIADPNALQVGTRLLLPPE